MPKINVYLPDELAEAVRDTGVPVSAVCQRALEQAVQRITAIRHSALGDLDAQDPTAQLTNFTDRTRTVLKLAIEQARSTDAPHVTTAHLLNGMLAEGGNLALRVLPAIEIEPQQLARELPDAQPQVQEQGVAGHRFSFAATAALELAFNEATTLGHNYVGCEHLLLGLVTEPDGSAGQLLRSRGAEPRLTRRAVVAALAGYVHLRAQGQRQAVPADPAQALAAAVRQEMQPLVRRLELVEQRLGLDASERIA